MHGEAGQVVSAGTGKHGKYYTLQLVCDIAKAEETVESRRIMVKGEYSFANEVYEMYMKQSIGVVGSHPQKTSIGLQVNMRDIEFTTNDYERRLG